MASNREPVVEPLQDSEYFPTTRGDATQTSSSSTATGISAQDRNSFDRTDFYITSHQRNNANMVEHLRKVRDFKIAIVCDDSGSMMTPVYNTQRTRLDELFDVVKIVVEIGVIFDSNGVDIHFLNGKFFHNVKDSRVVEQAFKTIPSGYTPLVPILSEIFESRLAARGRDKKLLVFVATDGAPTDDDGEPNVSELERLMLEKCNVETIYVPFLVCTDDPKSVEYLDQCYRTMKNVDVTDGFNIERERMYRCCKQKKKSFSLSDYVVKALVGAIDPEIRAADESN